MLRWKDAASMVLGRKHGGTSSHAELVHQGINETEKCQFLGQVS